MGGPDSGWLDPILGGILGIDYYLGRHHRVRCCPCIIECIACEFIALNYGLYVCTCEFSLHRESFDVILINTRHSTMGVLHPVSEPCQS
jgi:hypothetical protein